MGSGGGEQRRLKPLKRWQVVGGFDKDGEEVLREFEFGPRRDLFECKGFRIGEAKEEGGAIDVDASIFLCIGNELANFAVQRHGRWGAEEKPDESFQRIVAVVDEDAMTNGGVAMSLIGEDQGRGIKEQRLCVTRD